jgi:hypothetical protein
MGHYITSFLVVLLLIVFYKLFEKIFPVSKAAYTTNKNFAALKIEYVGFDFKQQGLFILITIVTGFLLFKVLQWLLDFRLSFVADQVIMVKPDANMCIVIALFSAMLLGTLISFMLGKRQLKEAWPEYLAYLNLKYKFNAIKVIKYTIGFIAVMVTLLIMSLFDNYSAFGQQQIQINPPLSLGQRSYKYSDIVRIKDVERLYAPNGNVVDDPHYIIEFADGRNWNSRDNGFENHDQNKGIIELIRSKTGLEPIKMEFDEDQK